MATLVDVAREAGVSAGVVSKVLGGKKTAISIPDATRRRIHSAAKSLNYVPDARAQLLRTKSSPMLGVLVRSLNGTFRSQLLHGLSDGMLRMGKEFLVNIHRGEVAMALHSVYTFRTYRTSAVLLIDGKDVMTDEVERMLVGGAAECGPAICVSFHGPQPSFPCVRLDIDGILHEALDRAAADGRHRVILAIADKHYSSLGLAMRFPVIARDRTDMACETLFLPGEDMDEFGRKVAQSILARRRDWPLAVLVSVDNEAVAIAHALASAGVRVPEDAAIVGYGNQTVARFATPTLTSVDVIGAIPAMAEKVVELVGRLDAGQSPEAREYLFKPKWIVRESFPSRPSDGGPPMG